MTDMSVGEFLDLTEECVERDRAASIAYHTAYAKALTNGLSDADAKELAEVAETLVYSSWQIEGDR